MEIHTAWLIAKLWVLVHKDAPSLGASSPCLRFHLTPCKCCKLQVGSPSLRRKSYAFATGE